MSNLTIFLVVGTFTFPWLVAGMFTRRRFLPGARRVRGLSEEGNPRVRGGRELTPRGSLPSTLTPFELVALGGSVKWK
jgi:hypothetical protein